jgi:hypothetical protein
MSVQPAPTNKSSPVFNIINYGGLNTNTGVSEDFLIENYLQYPVGQGTEEFPNGLYSTSAIVLNSTIGSNRVINGLSQTTLLDTLGDPNYNAFILESSTPIGSYDGGLTISSSNTINLVGSDVLINGVPASTGTSAGDVFQGGNNVFTGNNQFNNGVLSTTATFNNQAIFNGIPKLNNYMIQPILSAPTSTTSLPDGFSTLYFSSLGTASITYNSSNTLTTLNLAYSNKSNTFTASNIFSNLQISSGSYINIPNNSIPTTSSIVSNNGTFYNNSGFPYFAYNNNGSSIQNFNLSGQYGNSNIGLGSNLTFTGALNILVGISLSDGGGANKVILGTGSERLLFEYQNGQNTWDFTPYVAGLNSNYTIDLGSNNDFKVIADNVNLDANNVILNGDITTNSYLFQEVVPVPTSSILLNGYGTFYNNNGVPYFAYNNNNSIFNLQLATNSGSNVSLSGDNNFTGNNNFSKYISIANQTLINNTSIPANQATFFCHLLSGSPYPYFGYTDGSVALNYQLPIITLSNIFTATNTFQNGINLTSQASTTGTTLLCNQGSNLFFSGKSLAFNNSPTFTGNPKAPTPLTGDNSTSIATTAFVQSSLPTPKVIFNTPNNTIINGNIVSWEFTIPSTTFLGNNFTWNAYTLIPVVIQNPVIYPIGGFALSPSGTSLFFSGNGILQPYIVQNPPVGTTNGYVFSLINSIGVQTISFQSLISSGGNLNYYLQITFPSGSTGLNQFTLYPSPLKFEIQPISIATFPS